MIKTIANIENYPREDLGGSNAERAKSIDASNWTSTAGVKVHSRRSVPKTEADNSFGFATHLGAWTLDADIFGRTTA
jgi:hypothetical protein